MKFIMSQSGHRILPVGRIEEICIQKNSGGSYYLKVVVAVSGKGRKDYIFGIFKTLDRAEEAMMMLMNVLEDEFWAKVVNDK